MSLKEFCSVDDLLVVPICTTEFAYFRIRSLVLISKGATCEGSASALETTASGFRSCKNVANLDEFE